MSSRGGTAETAAEPPQPEKSAAPKEPAAAAGPDSTLGGYFREHSRPPAFEGLDGEPYSVSLETEQVSSLSAPYEGYLVFPRWAVTGLGVVGHLETPTLLHGTNPQEVLARLGEIPLSRVKRLLDEAVRQHAGGVE